MLPSDLTEGAGGATITGMAFQVIRVEKLKSAARLSGRIRHAMRDRMPENADPARVQDNSYVLYETGDRAVRGESLPAEERTERAMARFRSLLPEKFRKDAVQAIEILVTASHDIMANSPREGQDAYLNAALVWVKERFGGDANLVAVTAHRDESTPHLSLFVVPRVVRERDGVQTIGLSAKSFLGGPKELSQLQTDFHEAVGKKFNLERGRHFSPATHMNVHEYYALTNEVARKVNLERERKRQAKRDSKGVDR